MSQSRILVLGVGNILFGDEGIGVHAANHLEANYTFPENITIMEGGTLGKLLMPSLMDCDQLIVMDAVLGGEKPGTIYRLEGEGLRKSLGFHDSQHQVDLVDTLIHCGLMGNRPDTVVIGMEPENWKELSMDLTPDVEKEFERFIDNVLKELESRGILADRKTDTLQQALGGTC